MDHLSDQLSFISYDYSSPVHDIPDPPFQSLTSYSLFPLITTPFPSSPLIAEAPPAAPPPAQLPPPTLRTRVTRPPNAFLLFNKGMRKSLKNDHPTWTVGEISKHISVLWKTLDENEKQKYVAQANTIKKSREACHPNPTYIRRSKAELIKAGHYEKKGKRRQEAPGLPNAADLGPKPFEEAVFPATAPPSKPKRLQKRERTPGAPKHPLSSYMWFLTDMRPKTRQANPKQTVGQISKLIAQQWKALPEADRLPWMTKAADDKERYAKEMKIYAAQPHHRVGKGTRQKYGATVAYVQETAPPPSSIAAVSTPVPPLTVHKLAPITTNATATVATAANDIMTMMPKMTATPTMADATSPLSSPANSLVLSPLFYSPTTASTDLVSATPSPCPSPSDPAVSVSSFHPSSLLHTPFDQHTMNPTALLQTYTHYPLPK